MESHQLVSIFNKLDRNGDDVLSKAEIGELMGYLNNLTSRTRVNIPAEMVKIYNNLIFDEAGGEEVSKHGFINAINHTFRQYWMSWRDELTEFYDEIVKEDMDIDMDTDMNDNEGTSGEDAGAGDKDGDGDDLLREKPPLMRQNSGSLSFRDSSMTRLQAAMSVIAQISRDVDTHNAEMCNSINHKKFLEESQFTKAIKDTCESLLAQFDTRFYRVSNDRAYLWKPESGPLEGQRFQVNIKACIGFATYEVSRVKSVEASSLEPSHNEDGTMLYEGTRTLYKNEFAATVVRSSKDDCYLIEVVTIAHVKDLEELPPP